MDEKVAIENKTENSLLIRVLYRIDHVGSRMPSSAMIPIILCGPVLVLSSVLSFASVEAINSVENPLVRVEDLLAGHSIARMIEEGPSNFAFSQQREFS